MMFQLAVSFGLVLSVMTPVVLTAPVKPATTTPNLADLLLPVPCSITCAVTYARRFSSLMSGNPSANSFADSMSFQHILDYSATLSENQRTDTLDKVCSNYYDFDACLGKCEDVVKNDMQKGMESLQVLCQQKKSEYLAHLPCLVSSRTTMMGDCGKQNAQLTRSTKDLTSGLQNFLMQTDGQILNLLKIYCRSADDQIQCVVPSVDRNCGRNASSVVGDILSVSLNSVKQFAERPELTSVLPEECRTLFNKNYTSLYGVKSDTVLPQLSISPKSSSIGNQSSISGTNQSKSSPPNSMDFYSFYQPLTSEKTNGGASNRYCCLLSGDRPLPILLMSLLAIFIKLL